MLIDYYLERAKTELRRADTELSAEARSVLLQHNWPGNVREIEHRLRQIVLSSGGVVRIQDLPSGLRTANLGLRPEHFEWPGNTSLAGASQRVLQVLEPAWIAAALRSTGGSLSATAKLLAINPRTLHRKMRRYRIGTKRPEE